MRLIQNILHISLEPGWGLRKVLLASAVLFLGFFCGRLLLWLAYFS